MCRDPAQNDEAAHGIDSLDHLIEHLRDVLVPTAVIVCVGNDLRSDDGAGVEVARRVADNVPWAVFDARTVPENYIQKIVDLRPDAVLLVDALDFAADPGTIEIVEAERIAGQGPSTHGPAPLAFLDLLQMMHPCRCCVLGIQPATGELDQPLSAPVADAVERIVKALTILASKNRGLAGI